MKIEKNEIEFVEKQKTKCKLYNAKFVPAPFNEFVAIALKSFEDFVMPINGLRHPKESKQSSNWYIWAGEYSESDDFFQVVHIHHLLEICPKVINYLGLAPGWRFLFDNNYEDVWFDQNLLDIS